MLYVVSEQTALICSFVQVAQSQQIADAPPLLCIPAGCACVQDQLMTCTSMYVEEQLLSQFATLIGFVKRAEAAQKHKGGQPEGVPLNGYGPNEAAPVLQEFAAKWQASIDALHK